jgi:hypothetical protein
MDRNTMIVLIIVIVTVFAGLWMYTQYMVGYHVNMVITQDPT